MLAVTGRVSNLIAFTGYMTFIFLALCLAMTPLYIIWGNSNGLPFKRPYGITTFVYATLHGLGYLWQQDWGWSALVANAFVLTGVAAFVIMVPLAGTSNDAAMKALGKNWKRMQRMTYLVAILVTMHTLMLGSPGGVILLALLAVRIPPIRRYFVQRRSRLKHQPVAV